MTEQFPLRGYGHLKPLRVQGRYFVYNTVTAASAEVDARVWVRLRGAGKYDTPRRGAIDLPPGIEALPAAPPTCAGSVSGPGPRNLILQVSNSCNLRCVYCCADFGRYGGTFREMSPETAKRGIDFLFAATVSGQLAVTYFGGEPLLNLDTVLESARYGLARAARTGRKLALHLVTNGVLLDFATLELLDGLGFSLTVSLDGPARTHNENRPFAGGAASYTPTMLALKAARSLPIWYRTTVRGTFTRNTADFYPVVKFLIDGDFSRNIAYEPVFLDRAHPLALRWRDLPAIKRAYTALARHYAARLREGDPFCLWDLDDAIIRLVLQEPRQARCGSGVTTVTVTAEGDIYGCHLSTGKEGAWIGTLEQGIAPARKSAWEEVYLQTRPGCSGCWLQALCGGGCTTHALSYRGGFGQPYRLECALIEHRYRLALWILAEVPELADIVRGGLTGPGNERKGTGHALAPIWHYVTRAAAVETGPAGGSPC
ncbi:MAG TPA: radical SAM protein [Geobacteraceae bacterium]